MPVQLRHRYNPVEEAGGEGRRAPIHTEEAFQHGIVFQAKYVGSLDVPRPNSRMEIVAAMRRIRYEFKAKNIKKKKVNLIVSVDGVKVLLRKKPKRKEWTWDDEKMVVMHDPVYRIFYVSHDSQDLKIFSYIARDSSNNAFRCNVFKSKKKAQAMRVVQTVGQAFEVCHKLSIQHALQNADGQADGASDNSAEDPQLEGLTLASPTMADGESAPASSEEPCACTPHRGTPDLSLAVTDLGVLYMKGRNSQETTNGPLGLAKGQPLGSPASPGSPASVTPLASQHCLQLLQHQLLQQQQQTQVAVAQAQLLKDQLSAETTARIEAEARIRQLLLTNRDLLHHVSLLVRQLKDLEIKVQLRHPVDRSLQNLTLAQSLSLNLKNHYSLEISLPSTSTPASTLSSPVAPRSVCGSYLTLVNSEKSGQSTGGAESEERLVVSEGFDDLRRVEGSEAEYGINAMPNGTACQKSKDRSDAVKEKRSHPFIPKLNPPPPILRRRSSKAIPSCLESETSPAGTGAGVANLDSPRTARGGRHMSCRPEIHGRPSQERAREERGVMLAKCLLGLPEKGKERDSADISWPFSLGSNETRLHISLSEDELDKTGACVARA